jgi:hypothetical protein
MAPGKSAAFGGAPRKARLLADSKVARGGGFASLGKRQRARRSERQCTVTNSKKRGRWKRGVGRSNMEKRARASASALRAEIDCERYQRVIEAIVDIHVGTVDEQSRSVVQRRACLTSDYEVAPWSRTDWGIARVFSSRGRIQKWTRR